MLDSVMSEEAAVIMHLHGCKEMLLACERLATWLAGRIDEIVVDITEYGISTDNHGRGLNPFSQVHDLELDCGTFLI